MPALLSTASTRPNCCTAASMAPTTSSSLVTSQCTGMTLSPSSLAVVSSAPLMSAATMPTAPSRRKTAADDLPMPEPAPVMTATLPSRSPIGVLLLSARRGAGRHRHALYAGAGAGPEHGVDDVDQL